MVDHLKRQQEGEWPLQARIVPTDRQFTLSAISIGDMAKSPLAI